MPIKSIIMIACSFFVLFGCSSRKLTAEECAFIRKKEHLYMKSIFPGQNIDEANIDDKALNKCVSGQAYSRDDYECMVSADSSLKMRRCIEKMYREW